METERQICFYCERRFALYWKPAYIALLRPDALYLLETYYKVPPGSQGKFVIAEPDYRVFENASNLLRYSAENTTDYRSKILYDEQVPEWTPLNEVERYCVITFRDSSGKKILLRSRYTDKASRIRVAADQVFQ